MKKEAVPKQENHETEVATSTTVLQENQNGNNEQSLKRSREENLSDDSETLKKLKLDLEEKDKINIKLKLELDKKVDIIEKLKAEKIALQKQRSRDRKTIAELKVANSKLKIQVEHSDFVQIWKDSDDSDDSSSS